MRAARPGTVDFLAVIGCVGRLAGVLLEPQHFRRATRPGARVASGEPGRPAGPVPATPARSGRARDSFSRSAVHLRDLELRHGVAVMDVSAMLGHGKVSTTYNLYAHAIPSKQYAAVTAAFSAL